MTGDVWTVEEAMRVLAVSRGRADPGTRYEISMGDRLATELAGAHPLEEREAVGRGLLKAAACLGALFDPRQHPDVDHHDLTSAAIAINIVGFAGERLAREGRAAYEGAEPRL